MAGQKCTVSSGECVMVSTTAKTLLQLKAATHQRVVVTGIRIMGKQSAGGTDAVAKVRATRNSANFGTGTAATPTKTNPSNGETVQTTAATNFSSEPTSPTDTLLWWEIQPQGGLVEFLPPGQVIEIPGGQSWQLEATVTGTPTLMCVVTFEE